jgi:hypothetical protein|tara:strand:+ start:784 stop:924 length:141 start_codon:yes stop_codon:yes gene_type:complete
MTDNKKNMCQTGSILLPQFKAVLDKARRIAKEAYKKAHLSKADGAK